MPRRNTIKKLLTIVTLVLLTGCVNQDIIVDKRGLDEEKYRQDLAECQDYAHQIDTGAEASWSGEINIHLWWVRYEKGNDPNSAQCRFVVKNPE